MPGNNHKPEVNVDLAVRERLLEAAVDAFASFGFEGTSLRAIAQKAGVAFQLITYYFGSKEDLWMAVVDHLFDNRMKAVKTTFNPVKDYEKQLREWLTIAFRFAIQEPQLRQIMCQEYLAQSTRYQRQLQPRFREAMPYFSFFFEQAQKQGIAVHLSTQEILLLLRSLMLTVAVAPDEVTSIIGGRIDSSRTIDFLTGLVVNLFMKGQGNGHSS